MATELDSPLLIEIQSRTASNLIKLALQDSGHKKPQAATENLKQAECILESIVSRDISDSGITSETIVNEAKFELAVCSRELKNYQRAAVLFEEISNISKSPLAKEGLARSSLISHPPRRPMAIS